MSKQPKRTGLNKSGVNVFVTGGKKSSSLHWDKVTSWEEIESGENVIYLSIAAAFHKEIADAKKKELQKLKQDWYLGVLRKIQVSSYQIHQHVMVKASD